MATPERKADAEYQTSLSTTSAASLQRKRESCLHYWKCCRYGAPPPQSPPSAPSQIAAGSGPHLQGEVNAQRLRGVSTDLPAVRGRDADHRLNHRGGGRSGHPGAYRRNRNRRVSARGGRAGVVRGRYGDCHRCRGSFRRRSLRPARVKARERPGGVVVKGCGWAPDLVVAR